MSFTIIDQAPARKGTRVHAAAFQAAIRTTDNHIADDELTANGSNNPPCYEPAKPGRPRPMPGRYRCESRSQVSGSVLRW